MTIKNQSGALIVAWWQATGFPTCRCKQRNHVEQLNRRKQFCGSYPLRQNSPTATTPRYGSLRSSLATHQTGPIPQIPNVIQGTHPRAYDDVATSRALAESEQALLRSL